MKQITAKLGSFLLVLCLLAALLPGAAFAESMSMKGTVGEYMSWEWSTPNGESILDFTTYSNDYPSGINFTKNGCFLDISGTPQQAGNYTVTANISTNSMTYQQEFYIVIYGSSEKQTSSVSESLSGKVGTALGSWSWGTPNGENISNVYLSSGSMPNGLYIPTPGSNAFQIAGTPTSAGSGSFTVCVETFDNNYYVSISYSISSAVEEFKITKSPTSENAKEGSNATFIATATGYSSCEWLLISGGTTVGTYRSECNTTYGVCTVIVYKNSGKEYLVLRNIPTSMNGFTVKARFTNSSGVSIETQACSLYVAASSTPAPTATPAPSATPAPTATPVSDMKAPTITLQPVAVTQTVGNNAVLTVAASDPNGGTLNYQWYSNTAATSTGATAISGATQSAYKAPQTVGTVYYYCSVTSTKDGKSSPATTTTPVAVTYSDTSVSPSPNPSASPSASPEATPVPGTKDEARASVLSVLLIVVIVLFVVFLICQIIYIRRRNQGKAVPLVKWDCPECGKRNKPGTRFCSECGTKNPRLRQ